MFAKHGLEIEASAAAGDAKLQQALTADSVDIGIGSGPGMAFMAKGVPAKAVAVMYGVPKNMAVMVGYDSPIKTVDDLKGKKLGCTTVGSLTHWIGDRINQVKGWGTARHHHGADRRHAAGARGDEDQPDRRLYRRAGSPATRSRSRRNGASSPAPTPFVEQFITHVFFATRRTDPETAGGGARIPQGLDGHDRVHESEQGQDRRDHLQGDQRAAVGGRARL